MSYYPSGYVGDNLNIVDTYIDGSQHLVKGTQWSASAINPIIDEVDSIQKELGTNPKGSYSTVKDRLDALSTSTASHTHGNITNDGKIGSTSNLPLITTTSGTVTTGSFGTGANTFCQGNDSRLSDARTPTTHTHAGTDITSVVANATNADTLDTIDSTGFFRATKVTAAQINTVTLPPGYYNVENETITGLPNNYNYIIQMGPYTSGGYPVQIACPYASGNNLGMYYRTAVDSTWGTWEKVISKKTMTGNSSAAAYYAFAKTTSANQEIYSAMFRITVTSTADSTIGHVMYVRWEGHRETVPILQIDSKTNNTTAATTGIYYLRSVYPKTAGNGYYSFLELYCYDATSRDIQIEMIEANGVSLMSALTASTYNSTYQNSNLCAVFYNGMVCNGTGYMNISGNAVSAYYLYTSNYVAGESLVANDIIFLQNDAKWYKAITASRTIPAGAMIARCAGTYGTGTGVGAYTGGIHVCTVSSASTYSDIYIEGTYTGGVFTTYGAITTTMTASRAYIRFGSTTNASTTVYLDGNTVLYALDASGGITSIDGLSIIASASSHTHGNITNAGAIGTTANLPVITTTSGVLTAGSFGTAANTFCQGNDSRLSDSRTPTSHTHGNITNAGAIGSTADLPIKTTTSGVLTVGAFGSSAGTFAEGNHTHSIYQATITDGDVWKTTSDTTISLSNTWYTGASVSLDAGTYLVVGHITFYTTNPSTGGTFYAKLRGSSTSYAEGQSDATYTTISLSAIVTLATTITVYIEGAYSTASNGRIVRANGLDTSAYKATGFSYFKLA